MPPRSLKNCVRKRVTSPRGEAQGLRRVPQFEGEPGGLGVVRVLLVKPVGQRPDDRREGPVHIECAAEVGRSRGRVAGPERVDPARNRSFERHGVTTPVGPVRELSGDYTGRGRGLQKVSVQEGARRSGRGSPADSLQERRRQLPVRALRWRGEVEVVLLGVAD